MRLPLKPVGPTRFVGRIRYLSRPCVVYFSRFVPKRPNKLDSSVTSRENLGRVGKMRPPVPLNPSTEENVRRFLSAVPLIATLIVPGIARAQATREVTGKVTQVGTNTPLADATVGVVGSAGGVRTNDRGEYRIRVPQQDVTLLVPAIGFKRGGARVTTTQSSADFALEKDVLQLEGVTVT